MLQVKNVEKKWPDGSIALDNVSFSVDPGKLVALIGPSGSGKSTMLRVIAKLDGFDRGEINYSSSKIGMVFQQPSLWPHLSLLENVSLPLWVLGELTKMEADIVSRDALVTWGLGERVNAYPYELSGGEQQRGALARTLATNPDILCLDEITSALDPEITADILSRLADIKQQKTIILLVTHNLGFAKKSADHVIFMDRGRVLESGTTANVLSNLKNPRVERFVKAANLSMMS